MRPQGAALVVVEDGVAWHRHVCGEPGKGYLRVAQYVDAIETNQQQYDLIYTAR